MMGRFWTIGYEGQGIHDFVAFLAYKRIQQLVDVRANPISRKAGFSKTGLKSALRARNIRYIDARILGTPKPAREAYKAGNFELFEELYLKHLVRGTGVREQLKYLVQLVELFPSVLMCYERDHNKCHRKYIGGALQMMGYKGEHLYLTVK